MILSPASSPSSDSAASASYGGRDHRLVEVELAAGDVGGHQLRRRGDRVRAGSPRGRPAPRRRRRRPAPRPARADPAAARAAAAAGAASTASAVRTRAVRRSRSAPRRQPPASALHPSGTRSTQFWTWSPNGSRFGFSSWRRSSEMQVLLGDRREVVALLDHVVAVLDGVLDRRRAGGSRRWRSPDCSPSRVGAVVVGAQRAADDQHDRGRDHHQQHRSEDPRRPARRLAIAARGLHWRRNRRRSSAAGGPLPAQRAALCETAQTRSRSSAAARGRIRGARDRARGGDEHRRRVARERRPELGRAAALGADAGDEEDRIRHQLAQPREVGAARSRRRPRPSRSARTRPPAAARARRPSAPAARAAGPSGVGRSSTSAAPGFEVRTRANRPAAARSAAVDQRLERVAAEQRVDGRRVGAQARDLAPRRRRRSRTAPGRRRPR